MKSLFRLKKWLTIKQTAKRLSDFFGEKVSAADCLQLALDGHITISVLFQEGRYVIPANVIRTTQREQFSKFIKRTTEEGAYLGLLGEERFATNSELDLEYEDIDRHGDVFRLSHGIYDLPMLGSEKLDVMFELDLLEGRSPGSYSNMEGVFLDTPYGLVNLLTPFNNWQLKSDDDGIVKYYDTERNQYVDFSNEGYSAFLYPADSLGKSEFVFRGESIDKFERVYSDEPQQSLTLDDSLLVIGALLDVLKNAEPTSKRWKQEALKAEMESRGINISNRVIDDYFSMANKRYKSIK